MMPDEVQERPDPAPQRKPGQMGRPRLKGKRLPTLASLLSNAAAVWTRVTVPGWYWERERVVEVVSDTAVWYHSGMPPVPIRWVLVRDPQGKFKPQAFLCTDLDADPAQVLAWFVLRWTMEVTFEEVRAHLGVETQRQWSGFAIGRSTPALLGLFSVVTLLADWLRATTEDTPPVRRAAWYEKSAPTFVDALAEVRALLWSQATFRWSG